MSKPDFKTMSQQELKEYFLTHRNDTEAFHAYIDKLHAEGNWIEMPPLESLEDLNNYPKFTQHCNNNSKRS